jgi:hypothetical protein
MMRVYGFAAVWLAVAVVYGRPSIAQDPRPNETASRVRTAERRQYPAAVIRDECIEFTEVRRGNDSSDFRDCKVSESGQFGAAAGQTYYYALYCLIPSDEPDNGRCADDSFAARYYKSRALAIFTRDRSADNVQLLFERATPDIGTLLYKKPEIIQSPAGTLLYLPIMVDGTGAGNESEYYQLGTTGWESIDASEWLKDLQQRIPGGLQIWKGVWPNVESMQAEAGLYRDGDANCCPTGGTARIQLAIRSRQFIIDSVVIDKAR